MQFLQRRIPYVPPLCRWWWPSALARQDVTTTLMPTSTAYLDCLPLPQNRLSRFVYKPWRTCPLNPIAPASTSGLCTLNVSTGATKESECEPPSDDDVYVVPVIANSSHRDDLIYKNKFIREDLWEGDIANRNESPVAGAFPQQKQYFATIEQPVAHIRSQAQPQAVMRRGVTVSNAGQFIPCRPLGAIAAEDGVNVSGGTSMGTWSNVLSSWAMSWAWPQI